MKLNNVRLCVTKYEECFRFYKDILGFTVVWGDQQSRYAEFETGQTKLALFRRELMAQAIGTSDLPIDSSSSMDQIVFIVEVDNVEDAYNALKAKGVNLITAPTNRTAWGIKTAHFRDPEGRLIEIYEDIK